MAVEDKLKITIRVADIPEFQLSVLHHEPHAVELFLYFKFCNHSKNVPAQTFSMVEIYNQTIS